MLKHLIIILLYINVVSNSVICVFSMLAQLVEETMNSINESSGERYDWRKTHEPERPYLHQYHLTLVDKIFLCRKPNPEKGAQVNVICTFARALERIRKVDNMTRGIPKIMYLVGWQFEGHDSKYPAWSEVNKHLKRPEDKTALDSLRWLIREARNYHTTVSLHINMNDAYENSPLWQVYKEKGIIAGKGGVWDGEQSYLISHTRELDSGLAQKRIDGLLDMLPLKEAGTVHIDAFWIVDDDREAELAAMRKIVRYWRDKGVDVTTEGIVQPDLDNGLMGLVPMVWHINSAGWNRGDEFTEADYMEIPASLFCGGEDHSHRSLLFGTNMIGEGIPNDQIHNYLPGFCLKTLPWQYLNRHERLQLIQEGEVNEVRFSDNLTSRVVQGKTLIKHGDVIIRDGNDVFVPALWKEDREIIAFSANGYSQRRWKLPSSFHALNSLYVHEITVDGLRFLQEVPIINGDVTMSLGQNQAVSLLPARKA
jgi:hypothetical protein